jgi:hypothetical protein
VALLVISWQFSRVRSGPGPDRLGRAYLRLCTRLARSGTVRASHQGPLAYAACLHGSSEPTVQARELLALYARLRFGSIDPNLGQLREFERRVSRWRAPHRRARGSPET